MKKLLLASLMLASVGTYAQTVKKVMVEDFTGLQCGWCPEGTLILEDLHKTNPTNFIPVAIHGGTFEYDASPFFTTTAEDLIVGLNQTSYPGGAVDRKVYASNPKIPMSRTMWEDAFNARKAETAIVSVGFTNTYNTGGDNYEMDINVKFTAAPVAGVPIKVNVYIIEDSIRATGALAQDNYSSNIQGKKSPLDPWYHNRTFRMATSGEPWGYDMVPATVEVDKVYTKHVTFTANSSWVKKQVRLVAYVAYNGTAAADKKSIMNAEETTLGSFFPASVKNVNADANILSVYPNPATVNDVVKVEYNTPENGYVSMKVYNAMGQLVAQPFYSNEVKGVHTMQWKASENGLAAGTYFMHLTTPGGTKVQKITIN